MAFLSTLSLRRATRSRIIPAIKRKNFYPRSPCGERQLTMIFGKKGSGFLSTLSLRRATAVSSLSSKDFRISIHALLAESDAHPIGITSGKVISIHALLAESDHIIVAKLQYQHISIHALLAESDRGLLHHMQRARYFYPRSPCGERRITDGSICFDSRISIHALLAESDGQNLVNGVRLIISIHALLAESDATQGA